MKLLSGAKGYAIQKKHKISSKYLYLSRSEEKILVNANIVITQSFVRSMKNFLLNDNTWCNRLSAGKFVRLVKGSVVSLLR